jgi:hypothetical protein
MVNTYINTQNEKKTQELVWLFDVEHATLMEPVNNSKNSIDIRDLLELPSMN